MIEWESILNNQYMPSCNEIICITLLWDRHIIENYGLIELIENYGLIIYRELWTNNI
jgi:hypothetical protein